MRIEEFLDKEHGTTRALDRRRLSDSAHSEWMSQFDGAPTNDEDEDED